MDEQEEDFAALFEASVKTRRLATGQTVDGVIVAIGPEVALVDVGAKGEATIDLEELKNDDGTIDAKAGDRIHATIVSTSGGITLSRRLQRGAASRRQLEDAFTSALPVEGKVESEVKGGYAVKVGGQRAFCPHSQIDIIRATDPAAHIGHVYTFRIIEFKDDGRTFVVSRRALLEAEQRVRADEVRKTITVDAIVKGRVVSVRDFGAFIDLGSGVQGLLHVSEMGWSRATKVADVVKVGDEITVKVLRVDAKDGEGRIALGLKQLAGDPWAAVPVTYSVGQVLSATVTRVAEFGAFVELEPGVEALAHASTFVPSGQPGGWAKTVSVGASVPVEILNIDTDKRRISVAMVEEGRARADVEDYSAREQTDEPSGGLGSLADKLRGALAPKK